MKDDEFLIIYDHLYNNSSLYCMVCEVDFLISDVPQDPVDVWAKRTAENALRIGWKPDELGKILCPNCLLNKSKRNMNKTNGYDSLMHIICVEWGFCGCVKDGQPLHINDIIPSEGLVNADQFVEWVFLADDMDPNSALEKWQKHKDAIRSAFIECMGSEVVDINVRYERKRRL